MKDKFSIILITVILFVGGLITGIWTQKIRPTPPPHIPIMGEFMGDHFNMPAPSPEEIKKMEALKPQMEAFKNKIENIQADFRGKVKNVLSEDQKPKWNALVEKLKEIKGLMDENRMEDKKIPFFGKEPPEHIRRHMFMDGGPEFFGVMIYKPVLEKLSVELNLDSNQKKLIEALLHERRQNIINLIDSTPPPSMAMEMEHPPR